MCLERAHEQWALLSNARGVCPNCGAHSLTRPFEHCNTSATCFEHCFRGLLQLHWHFTNHVCSAPEAWYALDDSLLLDDGCRAAGLQPCLCETVLYSSTVCISTMFQHFFLCASLLYSSTASRWKGHEPSTFLCVHLCVHFYYAQALFCMHFYYAPAFFCVHFYYAPALFSVCISIMFQHFLLAHSIVFLCSSTFLRAFLLCSSTFC